MIASQMIAWVSFLCAVVYYGWIDPTKPPGIVQEVFSLAVLPSNSLLNPIFYSGIYKKIAEAAWALWRRIVRQVIEPAAGGAGDSAPDS